VYKVTFFLFGSKKEIINLQLMKKVISLSIVALIVAISFSSCKTHQTCPAYSKVVKSNNKAI
jgi:hypothetical protein